MERTAALLVLSALALLSVPRYVGGYQPTKSFFEDILKVASSSCKGKNFYKYNDFISAASRFKDFANNGSLDVQKREVAAFFANVAHETGSFCYVSEIKKDTYCAFSTKYPCASEQKYYGRGPLQLTWNYNYGAAGDYLKLGLLKNPGLVASNGKVAWQTALWFWMVNSRCHKAITGGEGFAKMIKAINGGECNGGNSQAVTARVNYYKKFCSRLGMAPGSNLRC